MEVEKSRFETSTSGTILRERQENQTSHPSQQCTKAFQKKVHFLVQPGTSKITKNHVCRDCGRTFRLRIGLQLHTCCIADGQVKPMKKKKKKEKKKRKNSEGIYKCSECVGERKFSKRKKLMNHLKRHILKTSDCTVRLYGKIFTSQMQYKIFKKEFKRRKKGSDGRSNTSLSSESSCHFEGDTGDSDIVDAITCNIHGCYKNDFTSVEELERHKKTHPSECRYSSCSSSDEEEEAVLLEWKRNIIFNSEDEEESPLTKSKMTYDFSPIEKKKPSPEGEEDSVGPSKLKEKEKSNSFFCEVCIKEFSSSTQARLHKSFYCEATLSRKRTTGRSTAKTDSVCRFPIIGTKAEPSTNEAEGGVPINESDPVFSRNESKTPSAKKKLGRPPKSKTKMKPAESETKAELSRNETKSTPSKKSLERSLKKKPKIESFQTRTEVGLSEIETKTARLKKKVEGSPKNKTETRLSKNEPEAEVSKNETETSLSEEKMERPVKIKSKKIRPSQNETIPSSLKKRKLGRPLTNETKMGPSKNKIDAELFRNDTVLRATKRKLGTPPKNKFGTVPSDNKTEAECSSNDAEEPPKKKNMRSPPKLKISTEPSQKKETEVRLPIRNETEAAFSMEQTEEASAKEKVKSPAKNEIQTVPSQNEIELVLPMRKVGWSTILLRDETEAECSSNVAEEPPKKKTMNSPSKSKISTEPSQKKETELTLPIRNETEEQLTTNEFEAAVSMAQTEEASAKEEVKSPAKNEIQTVPSQNEIELVLPMRNETETAVTMDQIEEASPKEKVKSLAKNRIQTVPSQNEAEDVLATRNETEKQFPVNENEQASLKTRMARSPKYKTKAGPFKNRDEASAPKKNIGRPFKNHQIINFTTEKPSDSSGKNFDCKDCKISFESQSQLEEHCTKKHASAILPCPVCKKEMYFQANLNKHMLTHRHSCQICGKSLSNKYILKAHMKKHGIKNLFKCPKCKARFNSKLELDTHVSTNHLLKKEKREKIKIKCKNCGNIFKSRSKIEMHKLKCRGANLYQEGGIVCPNPDSYPLDGPNALDRLFQRNYEKKVRAEMAANYMSQVDPNPMQESENLTGPDVLGRLIEENKVRNLLIRILSTEFQDNEGTRKIPSDGEHRLAQQIAECLKIEESKKRNVQFIRKTAKKSTKQQSENQVRTSKVAASKFIQQNEVEARVEALNRIVRKDAGNKSQFDANSSAFVRAQHGNKQNSELLRQADVATASRKSSSGRSTLLAKSAQEQYEKPKTEHTNAVNRNTFKIFASTVPRRDPALLDKLTKQSGELPLQANNANVDNDVLGSTFRITDSPHRILEPAQPDTGVQTTEKNEDEIGGQILTESSVQENKEERYFCSVKECELSFQNRSQLEVHYAQFHNCFYNCLYCPNKFPNTNELKEHLKEMHQGFPMI